MGNCASAKSKGDDKRSGDSRPPGNVVEIAEDCGDVGDEVHIVVFPHACAVGTVDPNVLRLLKPQHCLTELHTKYSTADCGPLTENITKHFEGNVYFESEVNDTFMVLSRLWEDSSSDGAGGYYQVKNQQVSLRALAHLALDVSWKTQEKKPFLIIPIGVTLYEGKLAHEHVSSDEVYDLSPSAAPSGSDLVFLSREVIIIATEFTDAVVSQLPKAAEIESISGLERLDNEALESKTKLLVVKILKGYETNPFDVAEKIFQKQWQARIAKRVELKFPKHHVTERAIKPTEVSQLPEVIRAQLEFSDVSWKKTYVAAVRTRHFILRYHIARKTIVRRIFKPNNKK